MQQVVFLRVLSASVVQLHFSRMKKISGLYAVTSERDSANETLRGKVGAVLRGGASVVQYRNKSDDTARRRAEAADLAGMCRKAAVCFIVNDDIALAREVDADGVHLGKDDPEIAGARALLGPDKLIGASCYNRIEYARRAVAEGADYLAFGSFFASSTKPDAVRAHSGLLMQAREEFDIPLVAIGGISTQNAAGLIIAGADALAVSSALFESGDVESVTRQFVRLINASSKREFAR
jgi:thiamine-phosphate pyrophosphorylase